MPATDSGALNTHPLFGLGRLVNDKWRSEGFDESRFPQIATESLRDLAVHPALSLAEICAWFVANRNAAEQELDGFGQPNLRLYFDDRFRVDLLFWFEATTAIHEHAFGGAFSVIAGSSLHCEYAFECDQSPTPGLVVGNLAFRSAELLHVGDVHAINPGSSYIHSLFHLDHPSVSVVVRTHRHLPSEPQIGYSKAGVGESPHIQPYPQKASLALLIASAKLGTGLFEDLTLQIIQSYDLLTAFRAARIFLRQSAFRASDGAAVISALAARDNSLASRLVDAVAYEIEELSLLKLRRAIKDPRERFVLGLLINIPDYKSVFSIARSQFPNEEPISLVFEVSKRISELITLPLDGPASQILEASKVSGSPSEFEERLRTKSNNRRPH